jgi:CubicO group peptidase (beta-lactamase class C family)
MKTTIASKGRANRRTSILRSRLVTFPIKSLLLLSLLVWLVTACSPAPTALPSSTTPVDAYWPTQDWRTATPEEQGMDSGKLASMLEWVEQQHLNLHSLLVIRRGYIVSENYFGSYRQNDSHELFSCTKSFISTLIGIALDKGDIDSSERKVLDIFPESTFANLEVRKQEMTLDDLLTMRSGLAWQESDATIGEMVQSPDWVKYVLDKPMAQAAGDQFNYCSGCSHVLSAILQQATGRNTRDYAEQNLFNPLGIRNVRWNSDRSGLSIGGWGLQLTPRDMAKLGYLYLNDGMWERRQVVSSAWVQSATQKHTETDGAMGYGYQWWIYPSFGAYTALGLEGQTIFVVPNADLIVVTTAAIADHEPIFHLIEEFVLPSIHVE